MMKHLLVLIFCLCLTSHFLYGQSFFRDSLKIRKVTQKANNYIQRGVYDSAIIGYRQVYALAIKNKRFEASVFPLVEISHAYSSQNKLNAAVATLDSAEREANLYLSKDSLKKWANLYLTKAQLESKKGNYAKVLPSIKDAELYALRLTHQAQKEILTTIYLEYGIYYADLRQHAKALLYYEQALSLTKELYGDKHTRVGKLYSSIGLVHFEKRDFSKAIELYEKAVVIFTEAKEEKKMRMGAVYNNMALAYGEAGDVDKSVYYFHKLLALFKANNITNDLRIGSTYSNIASVYKDNNIKMDSAIFFAHYGLAVRRQILGPRHPRVAAYSYDLLGKIYQQIGNLDSAIYYYDRASEANSYSYTQKAILDIPPLDDCMDYFRSGTFVAHKGFCAYAKYLITKNDLFLKVSRENLRAAERFYNELFKAASNEAEQIEALEFFFTPQVELFKSYALNGDYEMAFSQAQHAKSYVLLKAILSKKARSFSGIPDSLIKKEENMQKELANVQQKLSQKLSPTEEDAAKRQSFEINQAYNRLLTNYKANYPSYFQLKYQNEELSPALVQQKMKKDDVIFDYYFFDDDSLAVFMITPKKFECKLMRLNRPMKELSLGLRNAILFNDSELFAELGHYLYTQLFPFKIPKTAKRLVLIPAPLMSQIPLEALLTHSVPTKKRLCFSEMPYLLKKHQVVYSYAINLLLQNAEPTTYTGQFVGFAPVFSEQNKQYHGENCRNAIQEAETLFSQDSMRTRSQSGKRGFISELRASEREVTEIASLFEARGQTANVKLFQNATENNFKTEQVENAEFIHLATHGFANEKNPELSGLLLAETDSTDQEDGILYFGEIYNMKIKARLVCLSACETGLGKLVEGEGVLGVSRAFLFAGARNLLVSLWKVADESTSELMIAFYKDYLEKENSLAGSLRNAKLSLIANETFASPFYWSPFVLIGE
ncbi:MAG: CHAT domain-containing protein [Cytophagales bacterium]|nr:MAG: CHAT domain-containing protein [Cytophagales bacterium]TAF62357.1 MAG: CHAT domain-containing protein [Cytophagales bacterium]